MVLDSPSFTIGEEQPKIAATLPFIATLAADLELNLMVVDVGCRWGFADAWSVFGSNVTLIGFDPDAAECEHLQNTYRGSGNILFIPKALGNSEGKKQLFLTAERACSSLYQPDPLITNSMPHLGCAKLAGETEIDVTTMDIWAASAGIGDLDFIKLDTQGSELGVLEGAENCLKSVRALQIEVEFNPIYVGQPLFGDIDSFLRQRGFVLWQLSNLCHYTSWPNKSAFKYRDVQIFDGRIVSTSRQGGQLFWADAYYVRKEVALVEETQNWQGCIRDACIASVLGFRDLAGCLLEQALNRAPSNVIPKINKALTKYYSILA
ncbi:MAG: FkbM family methyltransferase [Richelia sp. CSU_2_1]|nr:FkbM family methyltransferase [Microcoleus sp. SU_5_6]NJL66706.1 FkbM family methyltransferase [Microcoleus sp. SM1_3_4]NJR23945.1 FkbM family methyltransferase [Richelia sp. CSU_2_1]